MKRLSVIVCFLAITAVVGSAQAQQTVPTNSGKFALTAQAVALPGGGQTVAGTVVGATYAITPKLSLRNDDILAPANDFQGYFGGAQFWLPIKFLAKTNLSALALYVTASIGIDRVVPASLSAQPGAPSQQHIAVLVGGGFNWKPSAGPEVNLIEVRWARLPGLATNTAVVSSGFTLNF